MRYSASSWTRRTIAFLATLGCLMSGLLNAAEPQTLREPLKAVLSDYQKIQQSLTKDSLQGVAKSAEAIASAIRSDQGKTLSISVAERADKLAHAKDIKAAREALKPLSQSLLSYLEENKVRSTGFSEAYCPMAKASWLQKGQQIQNPYMGKSMPECGEIKRSF